MNSCSAKVNKQQSLCQSCGLCCDGTLFSQADLDSTGVGPSWPQIVVQSISTGKSLPQPCAAFQRNLCVIYPSRPSVCQKFRCKLLKQYTSGKVSFDAALSVIGKTKSIKMAYLSAISEVIPADSYAAPSALFRQFKSSFQDEFDSRDFKRAHSKILLLYARLRYELKDKFRQPKPKSGSAEHAGEKPEHTTQAMSSSISKS